VLPDLDIASRNFNVLSINHHKRFIVAVSPESWALHDRDELESRTYSGDRRAKLSIRALVVLDYAW